VRELACEFVELFGRDFETSACIGEVLSSATKQLTAGVSAFAYYCRDLIVVTIKNISQK
jgi:hypothetical protein